MSSAPEAPADPAAPAAAVTATPDVWTGGADACAVKLPIFEGPLDLLLHLIRINEVDITDIPVARIAEQYITYLDLMREMQLDVAGEYLVMAATLAWIKSRMLLPPDPSGIDDDAGDPRAELVARLLEYQRFKEVADEMGGRPLLGRDVFPARSPEAEATPDGEREIEAGVFQLVDALRRVLARSAHSGAAHEVEVELVTVRERMLVVMEALVAQETTEFEALVRERGEWASRPIVVTTFLALLELTRLEAIGLYQGVNERGVPDGPIHVRRRVDPGDRAWVERVPDLM